MPRWKAIFFDLDNTLWDHTKAQAAAIRALCQSVELCFETFYTIYRVHNQAVWDLYLANQISLSDMRIQRFERSLRMLGLTTLDAQQLSTTYLSLYASECHLMPHAVTVAEQLAALCRLGIITNGARDVQTRKVKASPLAPFISYIISSQDSNHLKPSPGIFHCALRTAALAPSDVLYVGDSYREDVIGAKGASLAVVWYNPTQALRPPGPESPDFEIHTLQDLLPGRGIVD